MSLFDDVVPYVPRDPFAGGALVPAVVETRNSTYTVREHALRVDCPAMVTVACVRGTFAGQSWRVPVSTVALTRRAFVAGPLRTTAPVSVNGWPVDTWG